METPSHQQPEHESQPTGSELDPLLTEAFEVSFGMTMEEVKQSERFQEHLARYSESLSPDGKNPLHQFAIETGVQKYGALLNMHGDDVAIRSEFSRELERIPESDKPTAYEAAMVSTLNDGLIEKARTLLGPYALAKAKTFNTQNAARQEVILEDVVASFSFSYWKQNSGERFHQPDKQAFARKDDFNRMIYDGHEPLLVDSEPWPNMVRPNCLGVSLMLCAFAQETGAPYVYLNQIKSTGDYKNIFLGEQAERIEDAFNELDLELDSRNDRYVYSGLHNKTVVDAGITELHHSVAIESDGGKWIVLDPYLDILGPLDFLTMPETSVLADKVGALQYYWDYLPGLTEVDSIHDEITTIFDRVTDFGDDLMKATKLQKELLGGINLNGLTFDIFEGLVEQVYKTTVETIGEPILWSLTALGKPNSWINDIFAEDSIFMIKRGDTKEEEKVLRAKHMKNVERRFNTDRAYRQRRLSDLITMPLSVYSDVSISASEHLFGSNNPDSDTYRMRAPALELSNPQYMPALMVLNHLRSWSKNGKTSQSVRLAAHSSSQLLWHEAQQSPKDISSTILDRGTEAIDGQSEQFISDRVELMMLAIDPTEGNPNNGEKQATGESRGRNPEARPRRPVKG